MIGWALPVKRENCPAADEFNPANLLFLGLAAHESFVMFIFDPFLARSGVATPKVTPEALLELALGTRGGNNPFEP